MSSKALTRWDSKGDGSCGCGTAGTGAADGCGLAVLLCGGCGSGTCAGTGFAD